MHLSLSRAAGWVMPAAVLIAGCSADTSSALPAASSAVSPTASSLPSAVMSGPHVVALAIHALETTTDIAIAGDLVVDGKCLFLGKDEPRAGIAWPRGTTWDADRQAVVNGESMALAGETVHVGGGVEEVGSTDDIPWVVPPLPECVGSELVIVHSWGER